MMSKWSRIILSKRALALLAVLALALSMAGAAVVMAQPGRPDPIRPPMGQLAQSGFLGIGIEDAEKGALITEVIANSAAERAGLLVGDVITAVNGKEVADAAALREVIGELRPRERVTLEVLRDGETITVEARLDRRPLMPRQFDFGADNLPFEFAPFQFRLDMNGTGLRFSADGWKIEALPEDSPLREAGLQVGDLITAFDGETFNPAGLMAYLADLEADTVELTVSRGDETLTLTVPTEALQEVFAPMGMNFRFEGMPFEFSIPDMRRGGMPFQAVPFAFGGGRLGVTFVMLDERVAAERGVDLTEGALVLDVLADSPAASAGLMAGDVITAVNGEPVDAERTLRDRLIAYEPGDTVTLTLVRGGETLTIDVTLDEPVVRESASLFGDLFPFDDLFSNIIPELRLPFRRTQPEVEPNV
jgi:S1-C subfamily serine protease